MDRNKTIGQLIKEVRIEKGYTQDELAALFREKYNTKTTRASISKFERSDKLNFKTIKKVSEVLGVNVINLLPQEEVNPTINTLINKMRIILSESIKKIEPLDNELGKRINKDNDSDCCIFETELLALGDITLEAFKKNIDVLIDGIEQGLRQTSTSGKGIKNED